MRTINITIVGLGQIGASIGLALAEHSEMFNRVGHDLELGIARRAKKMGAVDRVAINLPSSVSKADIVLLCLPMDQIRETIELIAEDLREDVVVMDTGPVKVVVSAWAGEFFPEKRHYVGLTPVINPAYLHGLDSGIEAAHSDLFRDGLFAIVAPARAPSEAIKLAADLTRLLGAHPFFADPMEIDSLMAATHTIPQLLSAALLNATIDRPGWREARKIAGRAYAEVTSPSAYFSEPESLGKSSLFNQENIIRMVDGVIAELQTLRSDIEDEDDSSLVTRLVRARNGRELWWRQRQAADWATEEMSAAMSTAPTGSEVFGRLLGIRRKKKPEDE